MGFKKIELGMKVKDRVTGFTGIAMCRSTFLTGCDRIGVQPKAGKDGKMEDSRYFDEPSLDIVGTKIVVMRDEEGKKVKKKSRRGGPRQTPVDRRMPR